MVSERERDRAAARSGTKTLAGAILPSVREGKKASRACSARWLAPSAEQKKRECLESDSYRGYVNKKAVKVLKGFGKTFSKVFPRKKHKANYFW